MSQGLVTSVAVSDKQELKELTDDGKVQDGYVSSEIGDSSLRTTDMTKDCIEVREQFNSGVKGLQSVIPNEIDRWEKLRDQMLPHSDLLKYTRRVVEDEFTSWSEDEAFTSYLLDCLELDLAHGNKIKQEGDEDKDNKPDDIHTELHRIFPHEAGRWETLRDRMQSLPYFDRYVHKNPDWHNWRQDELFTSCLLDRLEEQLVNLQPAIKSVYIDLEEESQQVLSEEKDSKEGAEKEEAEREEGVVEEEEEEEAEEEEEEEEEEDSEDYYDDPNDSDYVPVIIEPRLRRKPGRYSLPILPKENSSSDSDMMDNTDMIPKKKVYQCDICKEYLPTNFQVIHHYLTKHKEVNYKHSTKSKRRTMSLPPTMKVEDFATVLWHCQQCESYVTDLKQHRREKHQVCEVCGRVSATPQLLRKHVDTHTKTEEERKNLLCDYCGKRYISQTLFKIHLKIHRGEKLKKYACDICNKLFNFSKALKLHKRIHNNEKPFECTYCGRRFTQRYNMFKHTRIHTGVKPYSCDLCEESFNHNISLKNHKKKKHGIDWWNKGSLAVAPQPKSPRRKSKFTRKKKTK